MSIKTKILILGNSSFVQRRVLKSLKKIKGLDIILCSKSSKINRENLVFFNDYKKAIRSSPNLVYISLINKLHYKYAKFALENKCNVIVDKPITNSLVLSKQLVKLAQKNKLLLAEANVFNYHNVYKKIIKSIGGINKITHIQSNFNIPVIKKIHTIKRRDDDALMDMSPYAAAIVRIFFNKEYQITTQKITYNNTSYVKNFFIFCKNKKISYFGNFGSEKEYISEIRFFSNKKIVSINHQAFALPNDTRVTVEFKEKNKTKTINFSKDDTIKNFIQECLQAIKLKKYDMYYKNILFDSKIREELRLK
jgi:predicted dehydrogenase